MIEPLTPNTQAILLLTAPLIVGRGVVSRDLLSLGEYNRLARQLREIQKQPADLIGIDGQALFELCSQIIDRKRLESLLGRGFLLSQAIERWNARSIWVLSRADAKYPKRLKALLKENAPPLIYGCGDISLLEKGGLAVVGSRHVNDELIGYTETIGRLSAEAHRTIISGGAKGIDRAAMHGALVAGGNVAGVMADSLEKGALSRDNRNALTDGRLVLISPYDPAAGFNVGHAMQRNKLIYALADAALVVTSEFKKGGTWTGAIEQLDRLRFVPIFVCNGTNSGKGNAALLTKGGMLWPNPQNAIQFEMTIVTGTSTIPVELKKEKQQLTLWEDGQVPTAAHSANLIQVVAAKPTTTETEERVSPEKLLFKTVREILCRKLVEEPATQEEVSNFLDVTSAQAKAWLARLVKEVVIEKVKKSKPTQFRTVTKAD